MIKGSLTIFDAAWTNKPVVISVTFYQYYSSSSNLLL